MFAPDKLEILYRTTEIRKRKQGIYSGSRKATLQQQVFCTENSSMSEQKLTLYSDENAKESLLLTGVGLAHDLRSPLTAILLYADRIMSDPSAKSQVKSFAASIVEQAERASRMVESNLNPHQCTFSFEWLDVGKIVEAVAYRYRETVLPECCRLELHLQKGLPFVYAEHDAIQRLLDNLLRNALEAILQCERSRQDGILKLCVVEDEYNRVCVLVEDNGPGMPEEIQKRILSPGFTTRAEGHGLGLALCMEIMREHGAELKIESEVGKGSVFQIVFPPVIDELLPDYHNVNEPALNHSLSILVVDDQEIVRGLLSELLEEMGHRVQTSACGNEALSRVREGSIDLVLMDWHLPDMEGEELLKRMLQLNAPPRILLVTGEKVSRLPLLKYGSLPYLQKPFRKSILAKKIADAMRYTFAQAA